MTKEQAIEILTKKVDSWKCKRPRNPIIFNGLINEIDTENNAIETVLSMLKQNSAEIEQKNTELAEKSAEIEKKDKIIDLIINTVYKRFKAELLLEYGFENAEQFKQNFERKSEEWKKI